ncbi:iron ABC transporter permease [Propionigenium maris DSM 9537]|uniref:Iron ABC transporter permease n=1 Tax=Propionigenium maris DSM 9537 TaxID=1123000 RepID=A0A9W6LM43_9FUSO|nr:iron ABC transporter permease [Propionigenium maris]GLI55053.1 iron ABC transporter permease [Propionigenium maris DSM 9537]
MVDSKKRYENLTGFVLLILLTGYILIPALKTFNLSFSEGGKRTLLHYKNFFSVKASVATLANTILLGFSTVITCGVIGTLLAFLIGYFDFPYKGMVNKLLLIPVMVPGVIIVIAFIQLYGESGIITKSIEKFFNLTDIPFRFTGFWGILFVHAYTQYIYFYMNVSIAIKHIDYSTIEAAKNLGAKNYQIFASIIFPFIKPALIASSIITFITGIGSFSAPSLIGDRFRVLTTQILFAKSNNNLEGASVQVVLLMLAALTFLLVCRYYEKKSSFPSQVKGTSMKEVSIEIPLLKFIFITFTSILILFILLPVITIFILSFVKPGTWMVEIFPRDFSLDNYIKIFTRPSLLKPIINSVNMSALAGAMGVVLAVPCSYIIVKTKNKLRVLIEVLTMLPWALPASAIAINLINIFNKPSVLSFNKVLVGSYILLPLSYFIGILPLILRSVNISMYSLNTTYEEASKSLGASWVYTFRKITLPIIMPGIISGFLLGFVRCIGDYTSSAYLYTVSNKPISVAMVNAVFEYEIGLAMAYGVLAICFILVLSFIVNILKRRY